MRKHAQTFNHRIFKKKLKRFMLKGSKYGASNTWLKIGKNEIYVRKWRAGPTECETRRIFLEFSKRQQISVLDLATFSIHESARRQGNFKKILITGEMLAKKLQFDIVHIECVHNQVLPPYLIKVGYQRLPNLNNCYAKNIGAY